LLRLLDESLDELAASAHAGAIQRMAINAAVGAVFASFLPWRACAIWAGLSIATEIQAWFATRRQFLGLPVGWKIRLWHVIGLTVGSIAWMVLGAMAWVSGSTEGALCAVMIWLSVIFFAKTNAYQSPIGFVVSGAVPGLVVLGVVLFAPHVAHLHMVPVTAVLLIALMFAGEGVVRMLAARKRLNETQAALRDNEQRYRLLTDNTTDIIVRYDLAGRIEFVSPSVQQLGYTPEQVVGQNIYSFAHPDERDAHIEARGYVMARAPLEPAERSEFQARRADGTYVWLESSPSPIRDETGEVIGIMTAQRNVTARRAMEEELRRKTVEAEAAAMAKSEFLSNMSHEIRTPLTSIIGFSRLLEAEAGLPATAQVYSGRIATASQGLLSVVNDILDFSKIEAGHIELDPHVFEPAAFVAESVDLVAAHAALKGLSVAISGCDTLPAGVSADSARLRQVLLNLLNNAIKFTASGGVSVDVGYEEAGDEGRLRIAVTDTGVGLGSDQADRLFHRFTQADNSISRRHGGTGLGLAICKSLVELMGGEIGLTSAPGEGSTFWFTVAAPRADLETVQTPEFDEEAMARAGRVLVVDDVAVNRELVKIMLSVFGHELVEASSGAEAVERALHSPFDLILMDLQMPGMDGISATRAIRATSSANARTPVLALTANVMASHIAACREAGMDDHIGKPIDPTELMTKVAHWMSLDCDEAAPEEQSAISA
jgi:PAS domain S-box-containing protein